MSNNPFEMRRPAMALLSAAIAIALYGLPASSRAQSTADAPVAVAAEAEAEKAKQNEKSATEMEEIVVSFSQSLIKALDEKRAATGQIDVIVAEDIGKFPDLNLAESLQRIPGVSIARDAGEGRNISVRGLGPGFSRVRINGMEALTTTGGTDSSGGANRGRGFDFNVFASELFNTLAVRKTSSAEVEEGSLGATVDLTVARPFDYQDFTFVVSGQGGYNDLSDEFDPRAAMLISNTFADGTLGALLSVAYSERNLSEEGFSAVRWDSGTSSGGFAASSPFADARLATVFHPRIPRYGQLIHEQERLGVTTSLQWAPASGTLLTLDSMFGKFDAKRTENFLEAISFSRTGAAGKPATVVLDGEIDGRGNLVYGVFDNVDVRSESRYDELVTKFSQTSLNLDHEFTDRLRLNALVGMSRSNFQNPIQTTITLDRADTDGYSWDFRDNDRLPGIDYGFDVNDPANWRFAPGLSEIRLRPQSALNEFQTARSDLIFDISDNFVLKGGITWKEYKFTSHESRRASETLVPALPNGISLAELTRLTNFGAGLGLPTGNDQSWLIPDINAFAEALGIYSGQGIYAISQNVPSARGNNHVITEEDLSTYLQLDFFGDWGSVPIRGDVGIRQVNTDQTSSGFAVVNSTPVLVTVNRDYDDFLPSFNIAADLTDDLVLRFGAAKVMSRPGLGLLVPGVTVSVSGGSRTVTGGDPLLDPFRATTADLGLEWYFDEGALLSAALFYKDIESFVQTSRETRPYNTSGLPESLLAGTGALPTDEFQFNIPINTPGGELSGFELSYQQPFNFLPEPWNGFGAIINYTFVESKIQYNTAAGAPSLRTDLVGLSEDAYNATVYFERDKYSIRLSAAYRDDYLTTVPGRNGADVEGTKGTFNLDMSAAYNFSENLEFVLEALNLTDEFNDQWVDSVGDRPSVYHHTGRQYYAGVRFRF